MSARKIEKEEDQSGEASGGAQERSFERCCRNFLEGVADAKIEDIIEFANVSKGTFDLYFRSKDEAAAEPWRRYIDEFIRIGPGNSLTLLRCTRI
jgi:AcrR family transcriptional regulator